MTQSPPPDVAQMLERSRRFYETEGKDGEQAYFAFERWPDLDLTGAILVDATLQEAEFPLPGTPDPCFLALARGS